MAKGLGFSDKDVNTFMMIIGMFGILYLALNFYLPFMQPGGVVAACENGNAPDEYCTTLSIGKTETCDSIDWKLETEPRFCMNDKRELVYYDPQDPPDLP